MSSTVWSSMVASHRPGKKGQNTLMDLFILSRGSTRPTIRSPHQDGVGMQIAGASHVLIHSLLLGLSLQRIVQSLGVSPCSWLDGFYTYQMARWISATPIPFYIIWVNPYIHLHHSPNCITDGEVWKDVRNFGDDGSTLPETNPAK